MPGLQLVNDGPFMGTVLWRPGIKPACVGLLGIVALAVSVAALAPEPAERPPVYAHMEPSVSICYRHLHEGKKKVAAKLAKELMIEHVGWFRDLPTSEEACPAWCTTMREAVLNRLLRLSGRGFLVDAPGLEALEGPTHSVVLTKRLWRFFSSARERTVL